MQSTGQNWSVSPSGDVWQPEMVCRSRFKPASDGMPLAEVYVPAGSSSQNTLGSLWWDPDLVSVPKTKLSLAVPKAVSFSRYPPPNGAVWVQAREKSCIAFEPQKGVRGGQKSSSWNDRLRVDLLPARLKQSSLKPLGFSSLAFLAGSSHADPNYLLVRKIKRQTSN